MRQTVLKKLVTEGELDSLTSYSSYYSLYYDGCDVMLLKSKD